jgi:hypothetical protein
LRHIDFLDEARSVRVTRILLLMQSTTLLLVCSQAFGQTVSVRVLNRQTAEPVTGALVGLIDESGLVGQKLTDGLGRAVLPPGAAGAYRIRVQMIGMATVETESFAVEGGASVHREVSLEARPLGLEGLAVKVGERCRVRPEASLTAQVWNEASKALAIAALTDDQQLFRYETMLYERDLDRDARVVLEERQSRREASMRTPFRSRPVGELMERGFVERSGGVDLYFAPDANVLLSDAFLDAHCFRLRPGEDGGEAAGLVGLAFEPLRRRGRTVDISGTLWLEPASAELQWLEYRYENLEPDIRSDELGGRVEFRRMPEGGWIVPRWWIRMPLVAEHRMALAGRRSYLTGIREAGGLVLDVEAAGRAVVRVGTGGIDGVVTDSLGRGAEGAVVEVVGTGRETSTDSGGHYRLSGLVDGIYRVRVDHPDIRPYGYRPEPLTRAVAGGQISNLDFALPSVGEVLGDLCREQPTRLASSAELPPQAQGGNGTLVGWVRDAVSGEPLGGATVRAGRSEWSLTLLRAPVSGRTRNAFSQQPYVFESTADETGFYVLCDLPEEWSLAIAATHQGFPSEADTVRIELGGIREHTVRISRAPRR